MACVVDLALVVGCVIAVLIVGLDFVCFAELLFVALRLLACGLCWLW